MSYALRLLVFAAVSLAAHALLARSLASLPAREAPPRRLILAVQLKARPAEPPQAEPDPEPEPEPELSTIEPVRPRSRAPSRQATAAPAKTVAVAAAATERPSPAGAPGAPVFGASMESTSSASGGPAVPVGNTLADRSKKSSGRAGAIKPLPPPVAAHEVTRMPLPVGRCTGAYTEGARRAGAEGTVVLDLVVAEDGSVREIAVVQRLGHGLTEAAVAAVRRCRFTPGERDGKPVPVRVRGFKIRFFRAD